MLGHQLVDRGSDAVVDQCVDTDVGVRQRKPTGAGDQPLDRAASGRPVEQQQPPHAAAHRPLLEFRRGHDAQRHAVTDIEQRRVRPHVERAVGRFDDLRQITHVPRRDPASFVDRRGRRDRLACRTGQSLLDRGQVGADVVHLAVVVGHDEVQPEVGVERLDGRTRRGDVDAGHLGDDRREPIDQTTRRRAEAVEHGVDGVGERDQLAADRLGERAHQLFDELVAVPGHLPVESVVGDLVETVERQVDRHAVQRFAGSIAVGQREFDVALPPDVGKPVETAEVVTDELTQCGVGQIEQSGRLRRVSFHQRSKCCVLVTSSPIRAS